MVACSNCRHYDESKELVCTNIWMEKAAKEKLVAREGEGCVHYIAKDIYQNFNFGKVNLPDFNLIAVIIKLIGYAVLIGGLVYGSMMGMSIAGFSWTIAGAFWAAGFFAAMILLGFGEIIKLLASIDRKLTR